ncbi:LuxR family two component transcriptional regulator [Crenobacter luteus]|uniref:Two-component system response regulator n=1 Tax=Crenobacter luteus TaxID=1452487 RepID=A0A165G5Y5_9NEIS|nr:response regulator [Crenobacter luteus]KZE35204.1 two-component system response regulator [Crenobacter luteus]TCP10700.1 LuxR family two component transcriptional regulator [Crenobacter luteus]
MPHRLAIIDDDAAVRDALLWLLEDHGYAADGYDSAEAFLDAAVPDLYQCLVLDLRLTGMSGIMLLERLAELPYAPPVIMLTAHGDVPHAVSALKLGAADFLEKPFDNARLLGLVETCIAQDAAARDKHRRLAGVADALASLTERERQVMALVLAGKLNKQIADALAISMKTVEVHRARVFDKMGVKSAVELANRVAVLGEDAVRQLKADGEAA